MRVLDALSAARTGRKKTKEISRLNTVWSGQELKGQVLSEYPRPQMQRDEWICLNGYWHYAITTKGGHPENFDGRILVPFSPESSRSGVERKLKPGEYLWYFHSVDLPEVPEGKRLLLHFGAVDERCIVWWNGKLLGGHRGGYLPFSFDVTQQLHEGKNTIWVRVQDDTDTGTACRGKQTLHPKGMFYTAQSGIWQTAWLEWVPDNYIEQIRITPLFDEGEVKLELKLTHPADAKVLIQGKWTSYLHHIRAGEKETVIALPEVHSWSPEDPFLYDVAVWAGEDCVRSYFALRKFSVGTDEKAYPRLLLNNRPYFFNGVLDQGYWPESLYTPPSDEAMVFDITRMKELGFNMLRKHIKIEPMRWYYHCDRIGMVVWQDMVNGGGPLDLRLMCYLPTAFPAVTDRIKDSHYRFFARTDRQGRLQWEEDCMAEVEQLYNCPCIGMWVPFNEGWGQFDALRITEQIKKADPTRPVDHASGWFDQGGGDIKSVHNYFRALRVKRDRRPFVLSEYGGYSCPVQGHTWTDVSYGYRSYRSRKEFSAAFRRLQRKVRSLEKKGLSGAVYTQVSDVEEEINGLYTYDRKICKISAAGAAAAERDED
ncbi:MAG: glycoside hydrolase family 2 TIM barrel-domain containing protein [Lachnospiraceae bacterium]|nr:glycoside hydrolase family 2 TIM barrel-domain containing protein [Lachnospiraceae bacterium]